LNNKLLRELKKLVARRRKRHREANLPGKLFFLAQIGEAAGSDRAQIHDYLLCSWLKIKNSENPFGSIGSGS
jgi:hypothetical protein